MRKILLIILLIIATAQAADKIKLTGKQYVGDILYVPDSMVFVVNGDGDSVAVKSVTTFTGDSLNDSIIGAFKDYLYLYAKYNIWDDTVYGGESPDFYWTIRGTQTFVNIGTPTSPDLCTVFHWRYDSEGNKVVGARLAARPIGRKILDTCNNVTISRRTVYGAYSDTSGLMTLPLTKSKCLDSLNKYDVGVYYERKITWLWKNITVPDADSFYLAD